MPPSRYFLVLLLRTLSNRGGQVIALHPSESLHSFSLSLPVFTGEPKTAGTARFPQAPSCTTSPASTGGRQGSHRSRGCCDSRGSNDCRGFGFIWRGGVMPGGRRGSKWGPPSALPATTAVLPIGRGGGGGMAVVPQPSTGGGLQAMLPRKREIDLEADIANAVNRAKQREQE